MAEQNPGQEQTQKPNVRLAHGETPVTVEGVVNIGTTPGMYLPSEAEQRKGFYVSHPHVLVSQYYPKYRHALNVGASAQATRPKVEETLDTGGDPVDRLATQADNDPEFKAQNGGGSNAETV